MQLEKTLISVAELAREAGRRIMPFFQKGCAHQLKDDRSPLTEADLASHEFLTKSLRELAPRRTVVSEESAKSNAPAIGEDYWLIDPLDGTKEFLKGNPEFTVNVALMRRGGPVLGVVHAPALDVTYLGHKGAGAWRQERAEPPGPIHTREAAANHPRVVASKDHRGPGVEKFLSKLPAYDLASIGSSLKFCLLAEGKADVYLRDLPTMEWDTAAAQCVLEAAGGVVLGLDGEPLAYGKPGMKNTGFLAAGDPSVQWHKLA